MDYIEGTFIFSGGAICLELLTPQGWSSVYTVEMIITQLGATIVEGNGRVAFGAFGKHDCYKRRRHFIYAGIFESLLHELDQGHASAQADFKRIVELHEKNGKKS